MGKVKGSILAKVVKALRAAGEEAREQVPENLRHYLEGRILSTTWHDEQDYLELISVLAELLPDPGMDVWEFMGRDSARTAPEARRSDDLSDPTGAGAPVQPSIGRAVPS